jgi:EAL domain-containing protein (putative c-di-GMP-specific phosphodiesterase class I)
VPAVTPEIVYKPMRITGKKTVAEFVETLGVELMLREIGIDYTQGFLRHRPAPIREMFVDPHGPDVARENAPWKLESGHEYQASVAT